MTTPTPVTQDHFHFNAQAALKAGLIVLANCEFDKQAGFASPVQRSNSDSSRRVPAGHRKTNSELRAEDFEAAKRAIRNEDFASLSKLVATPKEANWHAEKLAWSLLDEAVKANSVLMVQWLLDKGANPNTLFFQDQPCRDHEFTRPGMYFSPLAQAIDMRHVEIVLLLLARGAKLSLPTVWLEADDNVSCRELAEDRGMWPSIEAHLISQSVAPASATRHAPRL